MLYNYTIIYTEIRMSPSNKKKPIGYMHCISIGSTGKNKDLKAKKERAKALLLIFFFYWYIPVSLLYFFIAFL